MDNSKFSWFRHQLMNWHRQVNRQMPWKGERDPYRIWISEIILQQTRVQQGWAYYERFLQAFPNVYALAEATADEVLKQWEGLGYYSRARNLHAAAQQIVQDFDGQLPADYEQLLSLKGIGPYTAAAIASFAFELPHAVVDGNVQRVLTRFAGIHQAVNSSQGRKIIQQTAQQVLGDASPAAFNQAMLDFGALQCTPGQPNCNDCPLKSNCYGYRHKAARTLPVKKPKAPVRPRYFHYFTIRYGNQMLIQKRVSNDIWKGLYEFPLIEADKIHTDLSNLFELAKETPWRGTSITWQTGMSPVFKQTLSHQQIFAVFIEGHISEQQQLTLAKNQKWISQKNIDKYAFPRIAHRFFQDNSLSL